jgi:hypothetical protein
VIDHTGYDGGHARGASAKGEAVDQAVELVVAEPFGIGKVGRAQMWSRKGRCGTGPSRR